ncbi:MAG TPA: hypothetical protein PLD02_10565 [Saprospiraceae bacterium]|nr:hypothetical protein [Saprospiraceae bacterium]
MLKIYLIVYFSVILNSISLAQYFLPNTLIQVAESTCDDANDVLIDLGFKFHGTQTINNNTAFVWSYGRHGKSEIVNSVITKTCYSYNSIYLYFEFTSTNYYQIFKSYIKKQGYYLKSTSSDNNEMHYDYISSNSDIYISLISGFDAIGRNTYSISIVRF